MSSFSQRYGYSGAAKEITIREDAPENLRYVVLETAKDLGWGPSLLRGILCRVLRTPPDQGNWSEYPNIWSEVQGLMYGCPWFKAYDIIEAIYARLDKHDRETPGSEDSVTFEKAINDFCAEEGIGWQLADGLVVTRGNEAFEQTIKSASSKLHADNRPTTADQIQEALQALSRRPEPNLRGAIFHGMGALECIIRDLAGDQKITLGEALKKRPDLVPKPVDEALAKLWGYASNEARHVAEGQEPSRDDAELIVGLAASVSTYLSRKNRPK